MDSPIGELRMILELAATRLGGLMVQDAQERASEPYPPASEPGTEPHMRSGDLVASMGFTINAVDDGLEIIVGTPVEYGVYLEEGTEFMAPRPLWGPLAEYWQEKAPEILGSVIEERFGT